ncbi:Coiled-coil domain-containing 25 [Pyrenophora seminiperda CCB06]|uniref:Coiled-coil domain-containing 25 n=1 Tax=Pyrenophora seminiperda CCB06 TaxID=1302712 RepID=A0A3M7ME63_9PLEO|nr:Coiled-coil domain-containing 25 [Pyrenophora seminiperda CCB06]
MVYYFSSNTVSPSAFIYVGKDKVENEELIKYGWDEDIWFHADNLSSAHIYVRLPEGEDWEKMTKELLVDCAQLTKANSIEGNKKDNVTVVYTPWSNLKKDGSMAVGQVGFKDQRKVKRIHVEQRENAIVNRLNKTKVEKFPDLREERETRRAELRKREQSALQAKRKEEARIAKERKELAWRRDHAYDDVMTEENLEANSNENRDENFLDDFIVMARIHHQRAPQRSATLGQSRAALRKKKKNPYKIVLEAVTQEKKRLHSILTYASNAPSGFGFVPAGHPEFTEWCKEQCRQRNLDVHIVSAKPRNRMHADPAKLSHHVHRVGHHFPISIIELACSKFGYNYDESDGLRKAKDSEGWIAQHLEAYSSRQANPEGPTTEKEEKIYIHGAVREMFPKIPEADLQAIVDHAFAEGTNRVGNAKELTLARKVQLAVVAHIRHMYTDYDKLLRSDGWLEARSQVEHPELDTNYPRVEVHRMRRAPKTNTVAPRCTVPQRATPLSTSLRHQPLSHQSFQPVRASLQSGPPLLSRNGPYRLTPNRYVEPQTSTAKAGPSRGSAQPIMHKIDGQMYQVSSSKVKLQKHDISGGGPKSQYDRPPSAATRFVSGYVQPLSTRISSFDRSSAIARHPSDQDVALPSVEREIIDLTSPRRIAVHQQPVQSHDAPTRSYDEMPAHKRMVSFFPVGDERSYSESYTKRTKPVYREEAYSHTHQNGTFEFPSNPPPQHAIDLTASPNGRGRLLSLRSIAAADSRGHYGVPAGEPSRSYMPDNRLYERRALPAHDYIPFQDGQQPFRAKGEHARYTRNGARYGE